MLLPPSSHFLRLSPASLLARTKRFLVCTCTRTSREQRCVLRIFRATSKISLALLPFSCFSSPPPPRHLLLPLFSLLSLFVSECCFVSLALFIPQPLQLLKSCRVTLRRYIKAEAFREIEQILLFVFYIMCYRGALLCSSLHSIYYFPIIFYVIQSHYS